MDKKQHNNQDITNQASSSTRKPKTTSRSYVVGNFFDDNVERPLQQIVELNRAPCYDLFFLAEKKEAEALGRPLVFNPSIGKQLTLSDCNSSSRLLIGKEEAKTRIVNHLDKDMRKQVNSPEGLPIDVLDWDTGIVVKLTFKIWESSGGYILNGGWTAHFVSKRGFGEKDVIGLRWNDHKQRLEIGLLRKHVETTCR